MLRNIQIIFTFIFPSANLKTISKFRKFFCNPPYILTQYLRRKPVINLCRNKTTNLVTGSMINDISILIKRNSSVFLCFRYNSGDVFINTIKTLFQMFTYISLTYTYSRYGTINRANSISNIIRPLCGQGSNNFR